MIKQGINDWQFKQQRDSIWRKAQVPGTVHTDLLEHNLINDPFFGEEEKNVQWVDKVDWVYKSTFNVDSELASQTCIDLIFNGLDTYATVYLNNQLILSSDNMFRTYKVNVKDWINIGENQLIIHFESPINHDVMRVISGGINYPADNDDSETGGLGDKKLSIFARKAPYHYGWDWGPRLVTSGIWKPVELVGYSDIHFDDIYIKQEQLSNEKADLVLEIELVAIKEMTGECVLQYGEQTEIKQVELKEGHNKVTLPFTVVNPKLWWSRGLGTPHRYDVKVAFRKDNETLLSDALKHGIRTVELVRDDDQYGKSFYLKLNGEPVFCKGANHIPNDSFVTRVTKSRYEHEIKSAVSANMNMLRVWGGGIYEDDIFYDLCDEHGILVWQDFMFACTMYPGDEPFLNNVEQEAVDQVKRLRQYASVVLWCGNNEIDAAWAEFVETGGWGWKQKYDALTREKLWADYQALFHDILDRVTKQYVPNEPYWPSSPLADLTRDANQHALGVKGAGDVHYWDVWHGKQPFEAYNENVGRFMSEYGFQSFPAIETVETFTTPDDYAIGSDVMLHHQKNGAGNQLIKTYMEKYLPESKDFTSFLYMSQVLQAQGIKNAIESHRRHKPYCMGTLYWQMNDCWPVASWSSMDYFGRWKALHYQAKESFRDIMLSIEEKDGQVNVYAISDVLNDVDVDIRVSVYSLDGELLYEEVSAFIIKANASQVVKNYIIDRLIGEYDKSQVVLVTELIKENQSIDQKRHYFIPTQALSLPLAKVSVARDKETFIITTDQFAKDIYLTTDCLGYFSANYFDLLPGEEKVVTFTKRDKNNEHLIDVQAVSMVDMIKI
ncbi:beta-mannosidase [Amphibacillus jilinensis]|uniref:beta-mannosidase n=1 Tax=Amphibacillus jilinensis TaxID=1216008 RepID=UPI0002FDE158|nr:glycoside hydrolase family 2 protein [Amphibacillus jilinensis]